MARALTSGELASLRMNGQHSELYLGVLSPSTVFTAQVNGAPASEDELAELTYDNGSAGFANAIAGQLVYVGSSAGAYDKGMVRLRGTLSGTTGTMKIGETSEIEWANNDHLTVVDEFPIFPKHVRIASGVAYMDYDVAYSDQHEYPDPVPALGPLLTPVWLGDDASVTVNFDASDSWALDGGGLTYSWTFPNAASTTGTGTATPTATYTSAGTYRAKCVVTRDYGGGNVKTATGYRYILVYDSANMPATEFTLGQCGGSWDRGGWSFRVTMYAGATRTAIRDRAAVVLFAKDWYGATETSIGPISNRENIVAIGWIDGETIAWDPEMGAVSFEVQGPQYWFNQIQGFPSGLESTTSAPTAWTEFQSLTLDTGLWHYMHWRTTATLMMDIQVTGDSRGISLFNASGRATLWAQMTGEAEGTIMAHPCCDRFGRLFVEVDPQIVPTGDRGSIPTVHTLAAQDLRRPVSLERQTVTRVGLVDLSGIVFSGGAGSPLFSLAPGHVPKWLGGGIERRDRLALSTQNQANELAGLLLGWRNNEYPSVPLPMASNHRMLDVCPHQYVILTLAAGDTVRGVAVTLTLTPRRVSFRYDHRSGLLLTDVDAEAVTVDEAAQNGDVPATPPSPAPPPPPDSSPLPVPDRDPGWPATVIVATRGDTTESRVGNLYKSTDFTGPSGDMPTWTALAATGLPGTRYFRDFNADPADPENDLYVLLSQTSPTTETDHELWYSSDGGANFSKIMDNATASGPTLANATGKIYGFGVDPSNAGTIWVTFKTDVNWGGESGLLISADYGSSWNYYTIKSGGYNYYCHTVRGDGQDIWVGGGWAAGGGPSWYVTHNGGSSWTAGASIGSSTWYPYMHWNEVTTSCYLPVDGTTWGDDLGHTTSDTTYAVDRDSDNIPPRGRYGMYISINDADKMWVINSDTPYYTDDAWSTMTSGSAISWNVGGIGWCGDQALEDDYKRMILFNDAAGDDPSEDEESIFVTDDWGTTVTNKSGTNYNTSPYTDAIPSIEGGIAGVVVVGRDQYH